MGKPLDLRGVRIYSSTQQDIKDAIDLIGQEVYMSDYEDFSKYCKTEFVGIIYLTRERDKYPFIGKGEDGNSPFRYFVRAKDAKFVGEEKKTLRACASIVEFMTTTDVKKFGDVIRIRNKTLDRESYLTYSGYSLKEDGRFFVHLGSWIFSLQDLYENYERYDKDLGAWLPLGIEE